ncbi:MAG TPA: tRNA methyl transferase PRC-barrel domain-containing protein, partial [Lacipirellulaceae bacterium]|nr:tRNA methyl transferase PRC-barrel domain-containing protein [Lacipirellulaceae bacterium]
MARVVLAMSGGVDSSVAAHLLLEQGHDVIGAFMRHGRQSPAACEARGASDQPGRGEPGNSRLAPGASQLPIVDRLDHKQGCCTASDAEDARRVADRLSIPFYALNLDAEFSRIVDYFVDEYAAGRTPNPCVQCNNWIKFGKLFDYADSVGAEFVATGHYARLASQGVPAPGQPAVPAPGRPAVPASGQPAVPASGAKPQAALLRGRDAAKDQSYVLFGVKREYLERMLLPVGDFEKAEIRRLAAGLGLDVAAKKDSQEICFVTRGRYDEFVRARRGQFSESMDHAGELAMTDGRVVGEHAGIEGFTVGQRKNLGVALGRPVYVVRIEPHSRRVVLGDRQELERRELVAAACNLFIDADELPSRCHV